MAALEECRSSWILLRLALVRTDVSEERTAPIIRVARIGELGTMLAVSSNRSTLRRKLRGSYNNRSFGGTYRLHH
jgi:hypothetical protein